MRELSGYRTVCPMAGQWQSWYTAQGPSLLTYRRLAAAMEFALRALEARNLTSDVLSEREIVSKIAWPASLTSADRVAWIDRAAPAGLRLATLTWLSIAARVLDDHAATVDNWQGFADTVNGVADLTERAARPRPNAPTPAAPAAVGPYRKLVLSWPIATWTNRAAVEALTWLQQVVLGKRSMTPELSDVLQTLAVTGAPDARVTTYASDAVFGAALDLADAADAAKVPMRATEAPAGAWERATALIPPEPTDDAPAEVDPGVVVRDLPTTPPGGAAPAGGKPGPYVDTYNKFTLWAAGSNGLDGDAPRLKREQAAAVLRYIVNRARAHLDARDPATTAWLPIALAMLGYQQRGDAFKTDAAWRTGWLPQPTLGTLWGYAKGIARQLDGKGAPFSGPHPSPTVDYGVMADEARAALVAADPTLAPIVRAPSADAPAADAPTSTTTAAGPDLGTIALLVLLLMES